MAKKKIEKPVEPEPVPVPEKKPARNGKPINVWLPDAVHDAIEAFRAGQRVRPGMTDVVELAMQEFLEREGYWNPKPESK